MSQHDALGSRMKQYEAVTRTHVLRRTPAIIRIDGRAFHTYARKFKKLDASLKHNNTPFSTMMHELMCYTTQQLVKSVQNCVLGYTQSDEISLLLRDWDTHETQQWFSGGIQKMSSISASVATAAFNCKLFQMCDTTPLLFEEFAQFDSRVYNLPRGEVCNYFIWRQQDASRNSVQMLGHHHFSNKEMHGKSNPEVQDMLMLQNGVNWNDLPTWMKRGTCVTREGVDQGIPVFTTDRQYIDRFLLGDGE